MKAPRGIVKAISFLLFIVLALQLTGTTCYGEELSVVNPNPQPGHQIDQSVPDDSNSGANAAAGILDSFHCPCHGNFTQPSSVTLTEDLSIIVAVTSSDYLHFKSIFSSFFQPPRAII